MKGNNCLPLLPPAFPYGNSAIRLVRVAWQELFPELAQRSE